LQKMADGFSQENQTFRNNMLNQFDILRKTASIKKELDQDELKVGQKVLKKINKILYGQDSLDWNKIYQMMNNLQDGLHDKIKEKYPQLNETEFRILCLSYENFDDKEISAILDKDVSAVRRIRIKIRKELGMPLYSQDYVSFFNKKLSITE